MANVIVIADLNACLLSGCHHIYLLLLGLLIAIKAISFAAYMGLILLLLFLDEDNIGIDEKSIFLMLVAPSTPK
jgi:hypothetical protein